MIIAIAFIFGNMQSFLALGGFLSEFSVMSVFWSEWGIAGKLIFIPQNDSIHLSSSLSTIAVPPTFVLGIGELLLSTHFPDRYFLVWTDSIHFWYIPVWSWFHFYLWFPQTLHISLSLDDMCLIPTHSHSHPHAFLFAYIYIYIYLKYQCMFRVEERRELKSGIQSHISKWMPKNGWLLSYSSKLLVWCPMHSSGLEENSCYGSFFWNRNIFWNTQMFSGKAF